MRKLLKYTPLAAILAVVVVIIWSETFVSTKILIGEGLSPAEIFVCRFILAYILCWIFCPGRLFSDSLKDEFKLMLLGLTGGSLYFWTENTALAYSTASNVGILVCSAPIITAMIMSVFYKEERMDPRQILGSVIAFCGVALVVMNGQFILKLNPIGDALAVGAALTWGFYSLIIKGLSGKYNISFITRKVFAYGILTMLPFFIATHQDNLESLIFSKPVIWSSLAYLGVVASFGCFVIWNWCLKKLGTVRTTNIIYCQPFFTMIFAALILDERVSWMAVAGTAVLVAGMFLMSSKSFKNT